MRPISKAALFALVGLMPSVVMASGLPLSVKAAAGMLANLGYADVSVSLRVFGGYVLQGKLDDTFVMIALSGDGKTLVRTELFRDLDGNGVFGQDEVLGANESQPLEAGIQAALSDPGSVVLTGDAAPVELGAQNLDIPGFSQQAQYLTVDSTLQVKAHEGLGVGMPGSFETRTETSIDSVGGQKRGLQVSQVTSLAGSRVWDRSTSVSQSGGTQMTFSPPDVAAIRANVASTTPDADAIRAEIQSNLPTEESIRSGISTPP